MKNMPEWLYFMAYGLEDNSKFRVLLEGERYAVVQIPGGEFANGQVRQYGPTTFYLVDKTASLRRGVGLLDCEVLQEGGRAKLAQWRNRVFVQNKETT